MTEEDAVHDGGLLDERIQAQAPATTRHQALDPLGANKHGNAAASECRRVPVRWLIVLRDKCGLPTIFLKHRDQVESALGSRVTVHLRHERQINTCFSEFHSQCVSSLVTGADIPLEQTAA